MYPGSVLISNPPALDSQVLGLQMFVDMPGKRHSPFTRWSHCTALVILQNQLSTLFLSFCICEMGWSKYASEQLF